jgi:hypothetical protein
MVARAPLFGYRQEYMLSSFEGGIVLREVPFVGLGVLSTFYFRGGGDAVVGGVGKITASTKGDSSGTTRGHAGTPPHTDRGDS